MARTQTTRGSQASGFAAGHGVLIVLFAAAVGVLLLAKAVDSDSDGTAAGPDVTTTTTAGDPAASTVPETTPTTPVPTIPPAKSPADVVVLVANGRSVPGAAKANADALAVQNYNLALPTDYTGGTEATKVYYLPDYQADAVAVAQALTIDAAAATALPPEGLPIDIGEAMVVVVLGTDGQGLAAS